MASLSIIAAFATAVQAIALDKRIPRPTDASIPSPTFHLPRITAPPSLKRLAQRQETASVLYAPDNVCGYFDGSPGAPFSCVGLTQSCAILSVSTIAGVGCCDEADCNVPLTCYDYDEVYSSSSCDEFCDQDTFTLKCTSLAAPYCGTVSVDDGALGYYCEASSTSSALEISTTYFGQTDRTFLTSEVVLDESTTVDDPTTTFPSDEGGLGTMSVTGPTSTSLGGSVDNNGAQGKSSGSSTNVGAIAGGAVGGVAVLALVAFGIFFAVRRGRKSKAASAAPAPQQTAMHQNYNPPPNGPPPNAAIVAYDPQSPQQQSPYSPQQYGQPQFSPQQHQQQHQQHNSYFGGGGGGGANAGSDQKPGVFAAVSSVGSTLTPDRHGSTSPMSSHFTDHRQSSMTYVQQQQQGSVPHNVPPTVYEAGGNRVGQRDYYDSHHHGEFHELN